MEKIYFQASPGLYCHRQSVSSEKSARSPRRQFFTSADTGALPTNGISYGNKAVYQSDGAWYARNGYVCLVLDTLLAGEIQGIHTGTRDHGLWWWNSRGYTPAGVEAWFGIRALDYLCTRPEVDTNRFGITGHSGGGAYTWTVTALDDRIKVAAPLAGMADVQSHILDGVIDSHCDCNFFINIYRWDFPAGRRAGRAASAADWRHGSRTRCSISPAPCASTKKSAALYRLYGATQHLGLVLAPGPHDETPELQLAVMRWFNRYLKGDEERARGDRRPNFLTPEQLKVL